MNKEIIVKELKSINEITLCKLNKDVIAQIPISYVLEQTGSIEEIDTVTLEIPLNYRCPHSKKIREYPNYDLIIAERMIKIDDDYYVIKEISEDKNNHKKTITCYGQEKKLEKNSVSLKDCGLSLLDADEENSIYSFDNYLYEQTGWHLGIVEDPVRYMENGEPKVRMQEETNSSFYSFITETIAEQFCCVPIFDKAKKVIHLYDLDSFGDDLKLILTRDNYLKSLEKTSNSSDIVTRLILQGNEEKCIVEEVNPTGYDYIENYSYFIENGEMSDGLVKAMDLFNSLTPERMEEWKLACQLKIQKETELSSLDSSENIVLTKSEQLRNLISSYDDMKTDTEYYALDDLKSQLDILNIELADLDGRITLLENEIATLDKKINRLNILCRRETAEDEGGNIIFTKELLEELKEFIYYDTYSDDSFIDANEIIKTGEHILERRCKPTIEFSIDSINFMERLKGNKFRLQPKIEMGLGDVISLYDRDREKEELVYFVGWTRNYRDKSLSLTFSNKKTNKDNTRTIADLLKKSKENKKIISLNKWLWNKQKYNKIDSNLVSNIDIDLNIQPEVIKSLNVSSLTLNKHSLNIDKGSTFQLIANVSPETAQNKNVIWVSSDENVAVVNNGLVEGLSYGSCVISAISEEGNKTDSCVIIVEVDKGNSENIAVTGLRLNNNILELDKKGSSYLLATVLPSSANQSVTYLSSDENIAKVDKEGLVTGVSQGKCIITVISNKNTNIKANCNIVVSANESNVALTSLDNVLFIGNKRISNLKEKGLLSKYTYVQENVNEFEVDKYITNPSAVVVMLGINSNYMCDISQVKLLLQSIKKRYEGNYIFVAKELPVGINYATINYNYTQLNKAINTFNTSIGEYAKELGINVIEVSGGMISNDILPSVYTSNGSDLNEQGCKMLLNNLKYQMKNIMTTITDDNNNNYSSSSYRAKIIEKAEEIVKMCTDHKANYSQCYRTVDYRNPNTIKSMSEVVLNNVRYQPAWVEVGKTYGWDCSSFVGCCYDYAGIPELKGLSCSAGTLQMQLKSLGAEYWLYKEDGYRDAKPGDIIIVVNDGINFSKNNVFTCKTHHTMVYGGDEYVLEAASYNTGIVKRKRTSGRDNWIFFRLPQLDSQSDNSLSSNPSTPNCYDEQGTIDGHKYLYKFTNARMTGYCSTNSTGGSGIPLEVGKTVGSFNMPYGSKLYIPAIKGKFGNEDGIVTVVDTGVGCTDIDLYLGRTTQDVYNQLSNPTRVDMYLIEIGTGRNAWSYTESYEWAYNKGTLSNYKTAFKNYIKYNGTLINFYMFKSDDKDVRNTKYWEILNS